MKCINCKGKKIFTDFYVSICPYCLGTGQLPDIYRFVFTNQTTGQSAELILDVNNSPKLIEKIYHRHDFCERAYILPLDDLFSMICQQLGVSEDTHELYDNDGILEFGWEFRPLYVQRIHDRLKIPSQKSLKKSAANSIARRFGYGMGKEKIATRHYHFCPKLSIDEIIRQIEEIVLNNDLSFSIGLAPIATGETGWSVNLGQADGSQDLAQISLEYRLPTALRSALDHLPAAIEKIQKLKDN